MTLLSLPQVGPERPLRLPKVHRASLDNGLRLVLAPRPNVPRVEVRLLVPAGTAADAKREGAAAWLLAESLAGGTASKSSFDIACALQRMGADVSVRPTDDYTWISGGVLSRNLRPYLELLAELVTEPSLPTHEVEVARGRLLQRLIEQRADPGFIASEVLFRRMLGSHPYGIIAPGAARVERLGREAIRAFWRDGFTPAGAIMVLVGDLRPNATIAAVRDALGGWRGPAEPTLPPPPPEPKRGATLLADRPGAVQTNIRLGATAPKRTSPDYFAVAVANTIFGGYFSSRLMENIRERKGYSYGPGSTIGEQRSASYFSTRADVRNDVTAAALSEIRYELNRLCALPVETAELEGAKRYMLGLQALALQSQQGLAAQLGALEAYGVDEDFLRRYRREVKRVSAGEVLEAARRHLSPRRMVTILVGDAEQVAASVEALEDVEVAGARPPASAAGPRRAPAAAGTP